jgi:hypothetical protein
MSDGEDPYGLRFSKSMTVLALDKIIFSGIQHCFSPHASRIEGL